VYCLFDPLPELNRFQDPTVGLSQRPAFDAAGVAVAINDLADRCRKAFRIVSNAYKITMLHHLRK
jgi:hypothetical protein